MLHLPKIKIMFVGKGIKLNIHLDLFLLPIEFVQHNECCIKD